MPSFKSTFVAVAAAFAITASAQNDYVVVPTSVPKPTRLSWCADQKRMCPAICRQTDERPPLVNDCNPDELNYGCICGDGNKPNLTEYSLTLPYHLCQEWGNQCVTDCGIGANACSSDCREKNPCGAQEPTRVNSTSSSTEEPTASKTASDDEVIFTGMAGSNDDEGDNSGSGSDNESGAPAILEVGQRVGFVVLGASLLAGFGLML